MSHRQLYFFVICNSNHILFLKIRTNLRGKHGWRKIERPTDATAAGGGGVEGKHARYSFFCRNEFYGVAQSGGAAGGGPVLPFKANSNPFVVRFGGIDFSLFLVPRAEPPPPPTMHCPT